MPIKILYTIPSLSTCDGIASYAMNYYRRLDHDKVKIDFLINSQSGEYSKEVEMNGDKVFVVKEPGVKTISVFLHEVQNFFKNNHDYDILHCHVPNTATFYLHYAKKYGIKKRILHSHVTRSADVLMKRLRNNLLAPFAVRNANYYAACTKAAGEFLFKGKEFMVIHNALELSKFQYSQDGRAAKRNELNCMDNLVIGFVGRLCDQKNPMFVIDIFEKLLTRRKDAKLLLIGEGPLEKEMREAVTKKQLGQSVLFAGTQSDVASYYQAMDIFLLPSRYEGLGIVLIEAQLSGLPTITSDVVPEETKVTKLIKYFSLKQKSAVWAEEILQSISMVARGSHEEEARACGFDIRERVAYLENYYNEIIGG